MSEWCEERCEEWCEFINAWVSGETCQEAQATGRCTCECVSNSSEQK